MIYVATFNGDESRFKIGYAKSPGETPRVHLAVNRIRSQMTYIPPDSDLFVVAVDEGGRATERSIHERFAEERIVCKGRREWFRSSPALLEWLASRRVEQPVSVTGYSSPSKNRRRVLPSRHRAIALRDTVPEREKTGCGHVASAPGESPFDRARANVTAGKPFILATAQPAAVRPDQFVWRGVVRDSVATPTVRTRVCGFCGKSGHNARTCMAKEGFLRELEAAA